MSLAQPQAHFFLGAKLFFCSLRNVLIVGFDVLLLRFRLIIPVFCLTL